MSAVTCRIGSKWHEVLAKLCPILPYNSNFDREEEQEQKYIDDIVKYSFFLRERTVS
jgi:hypothetical protein